MSNFLIGAWVAALVGMTAMPTHGALIEILYLWNGLCAGMLIALLNPKLST